jgi:hypothetical protein
VSFTVDPLPSIQSRIAELPPFSVPDTVVAFGRVITFICSPRSFGRLCGRPIRARLVSD